LTAAEHSLTRAAAEGAVDAVRTLLAQGVNVNVRTSGGQTPLMLALIGGHEQVVQLLRAAGADPRLRDSRGLTAFDWAERRGFRELANILETGAANLTPKTQQRNSASESDLSFQSPHEPRAESGAESTDKTQRWLAGLKKRLQEDEERQALADLSLSLTTKAREETDPESILEIPEVKRAALVEVTTPESPASALQHCEICNEFHDRLQPCAGKSIVSREANTREPIVSAHVRAVATPSFLSVSPTPSHRTTLWLLIVVTLAASAFITHYLYGYLSGPTGTITTAPASTPALVIPQPTPKPSLPPIEEKINSPVLSDTLAGKEMSLPEPEYPASARTKGIGGTVLVIVRVNRSGRVVAARSSDGDWRLSRAAVDAAIKARFDPAKLSNGAVQGTISYKFRP
jgi:TonB family protein